jgi:23S rRNA pseudouridine955/2504/2580 synthase
MSRVQTITVGPGDGDQRLDRWLKRLFPHVAQTRIEKMCRKGELRIDGGRCKASSRIETGMQVRIPPLPEPGQVESAPKPSFNEKDAEMIRDCVLWKDDHIIALNKPPGLATQGGSGQTRHVDGLSEALTSAWTKSPGLCTGWTRTPRASCCWRAPVPWPSR